MANPALVFFKKTYKVLIIILAAVIFFLGYNTYLVDRSLLNLKFALNKVGSIKNLEDAKKVSAILESSLLVEVSSKEITPTNIARIELAKDMLNRPSGLTGMEKDTQEVASAIYYSLLKEVGSQKLEGTSIPMIEMSKDILVSVQDVSQLEDVKFALQKVIQEKEKQRPAALNFLDKIAQVFMPGVTKISKQDTERQVKDIQYKIKSAATKIEKQAFYYELGNAYTQLSDFDKARQAYKDAAELNPESALAKKARFNMAWNEKNRGNLDAAEKEFQVISQSYGQEEVGIFSKYQTADVLRQKGDFEKAAQVYTQVADDHPEVEFAQIALFRAGYTYLFDLKDYKKAKEIFERLKKEFPGSEFAKYGDKNLLEYISRNYRKEGFLKLEDGFKLLVEGYESSSFEKYKEAEERFDLALKANAKDGVSLAGKALANLWLGDKEKALEYAKEAVSIAPNNELTSVNLGYIYIQLGLFDEGIKEYKRFIAINPFSSHGYYNLGYIYALKIQLRQAADAFAQATKIDPTFARGYNNLGWCYWQLKEYALAIEAFEGALRINSKYYDALFNLGIVYRTVGRLSDAEKTFSKIPEGNILFQKAKKQLDEIAQIRIKQNIIK